MIELINSDCLEAMRKMDDNSIDCIVTDPPYGLHFMGKTWDKFKKTNFDERGDYKHLDSYSCENRSGNIRKIGCANAEAGAYDDRRNDEFQEFMFNFGKEALRILKPGGHIVMFGAPRRFHRQACGLEDAGFEIRDCLFWCFGQGFPKSHNFGKQLGGDWTGYGTSLKPAYEPIILGMKPLDGTFSANAEKWGVAGINIDACRIEGNWNRSTTHRDDIRSGAYIKEGRKTLPCNPQKSHELGRWPANLLLDDVAAEMLDQQTGVLKSGSGNRRPNGGGKMFNGFSPIKAEFDASSGGASRFFYCAKASSAERQGSKHPTIKPKKLIAYLIKLIAPPGDPIILDPFMGSGTTGVVCKELGYRFIGIELEKDYFEDAKMRINLAHAKEREKELF